MGKNLRDNREKAYAVKRNSFKGIAAAMAIVLVLLCSCGQEAESASEISDLFQYAVQVEDGIFSPRGTEFFADIDDVLQDTGLDESAVSDAPGGKQIVSNIDAAGFPDGVMAIYSFADEKLVSVQYVIRAAGDKAPELYQALYDQAASVMPEPFGNTLEDIKNGTEVSWEDANMTYVRLSFPDTGDPDTVTAILGIHATAKMQ